jgi:hypothetical protein
VSLFRRKEQPVNPDEPAFRVLHRYESDNEDYRRLLLRDPIGQTQAGVEVVMERDGVKHYITLHGVREFEAPVHSTVTWPDGSTFYVDA